MKITCSGRKADEVVLDTNAAFARAISVKRLFLSYLLPADVVTNDHTLQLKSNGALPRAAVYGTS
jgi:hypothetical protein